MRSEFRSQIVNDPVNTEGTIGLVLCPLTALYRFFLKHCTLTYKAVGTIWRDLSKTLQRRKGPDPRPLWFLVGAHLVHDIAYSSRYLYIFLIYCFYHLTCLVNNFYGLSALVDFWSAVFLRRLIYTFLNVRPFDYTAFAVSGKVGIL